MNSQSLTGQIVTLNSSTGKIERIVVKDLGEVLLVCRPEEYERAKLEAREPVCVGFKRVYIA